MIRFYCPDILDTMQLPESDSGHCVRVLRMRDGDLIEAVDGHGILYTLRLVDAHPKHAMVEVVARAEQPLPWSQQIAIAVAPTKNMDRMEWLVEKLVEVGVNRIIPIKCRYSERKEIKVDRLHKIAVSAMKQSLKAVLPVIDPMTPVADVVSTAEYAQRYIAYCSDELPRQQLASLYRADTDTLILIGPEGDFSDHEVRDALDAGYQPVTLGDNRLRTETAALYACTAFHVIDSLKN